MTRHTGPKGSHSAGAKPSLLRKARQVLARCRQTQCTVPAYRLYLLPPRDGLGQSSEAGEGYVQELYFPYPRYCERSSRRRSRVGGMERGDDERRAGGLDGTWQNAHNLPVLNKNQRPGRRVTSIHPSIHPSVHPPLHVAVVIP